MKKLTLLCLLMVIPGKAFSRCLQDAKILGAKYRLTETRLSPKKTVSSHELIFWRKNNQVGYVYPQQKITEIWSHLRNGQIRPIRYFDQFQRGIEYQPEEINQGKGIKNWQQKYQLLDNQHIKALMLLSSKASGCQQYQQYKKTTADENIELTWLSPYQLPKKLSISSPTINISWTLEELILDKNKVNAFFKNRRSYKLTDFADIGDNESDPFLNKMIHQGFSHPISSTTKQLNHFKAL